MMQERHLINHGNFASGSIYSYYINTEGSRRIVSSIRDHSHISRVMDLGRKRILLPLHVTPHAIDRETSGVLFQEEVTTFKPSQNLPHLLKYNKRQAL
jgi:hypothetical protein